MIWPMVWLVENGVLWLAVLGPATVAGLWWKRRARFRWLVLTCLLTWGVFPVCLAVGILALHGA